MDGEQLANRGIADLQPVAVLVPDLLRLSAEDDVQRFGPPLLLEGAFQSVQQHFVAVPVLEAAHELQVGTDEESKTCF